MTRSLNRRMRAASRTEAQAPSEQGPPDLAKLAAGLVLKALAALEKIIDDAAATSATRLRAIAMVLDRVYGRPAVAKAPASDPMAGLPRIDAPPQETLEEWCARHPEVVA